MKIGNPLRFFVGRSDEAGYSDKKLGSTLVARKDFVTKYCSIDSAVELDWHTEEQNDDVWVKISYNGGFTYPFKFKYKNNFLLKHEVITIETVVNNRVEFDLSSYSNSLFEETKSGHISLLSKNNEGWLRNLYDFSYTFDDENRKLIVDIISEIPNDSASILLIINIDNASAMALAVASPVYSTNITAIPSVYDEEFGACNVLDESIPQITCTTKFDDINKLSLKLCSADENVEGNVELAINCGGTSWSEVVAVTKTETWVNLNIPNRLTGTCVISRVIGSSADTLKSNGDTISLCVTNIKVEII